MNFVLLLLVAVISYLLGCSNGAIIVSKFLLRNDIRNHGSGNAGLTNFYRTFGGGLTIVVILFDVIKMILSVVIALLILKNSAYADVFVKLWAGAYCLVGHNFPIMFDFKGGKGVLSGGTLCFFLDWRVVLVVWGGFILLVLLTRYVSLGSIWGGASFFVITSLLFRTPAVIILSLVCGTMVVWGHRENIKRLVQGNERKFSFRKKRKTRRELRAEAMVREAVKQEDGANEVNDQ